ncbi:hypothetical protein WJX73_008252 [Symbiochloris irregularis]|uniref:Uncharacterized protein n=1 Tax=Symbiochloris irregularis TaxID=706552 RepID=A0AAW1NZ57_9CHLO
MEPEYEVDEYLDAQDLSGQDVRLHTHVHKSQRDRYLCPTLKSCPWTPRQELLDFAAKFSQKVFCNVPAIIFPDGWGSGMVVGRCIKTNRHVAKECTADASALLHSELPDSCTAQKVTLSGASRFVKESGLVRGPNNVDYSGDYAAFLLPEQASAQLGGSLVQQEFVNKFVDAEVAPHNGQPLVLVGYGVSYTVEDAELHQHPLLQAYLVEVVAVDKDAPGTFQVAPGTFNGFSGGVLMTLQGNFVGLHFAGNHEGFGSHLGRASLQDFHYQVLEILNAKNEVARQEERLQAVGTSYIQPAKTGPKLAHMREPSQQGCNNAEQKLTEAMEGWQRLSPVQ